MCFIDVRFHYIVIILNVHRTRATVSIRLCFMFCAAFEKAEIVAVKLLVLDDLHLV